MSSDAKMTMCHLSEIESTITLIFKYDPHLQFIDSFEKLNQQFSEINDLLTTNCRNEKDYWIIYDAVVVLLPYLDRLIFEGYSDQILEFLLTLNSKLGSNFIFCTSRFIPLRLQLFTTICSAFANTNESREKDALEFIKSFKDELDLLKQLEESNVNGLSISITMCNNQKQQLSELFDIANSVINLMSIHFTTSIKIDFEDKSKKNAQPKKKGSQKEKEENPEAIPIPSLNTAQLIINAFNSPLKKGEYNNKYSSVVAAWTNPECQLGPMILYRLLFSFLKAGKISMENLTNLKNALPDDLIVKLSIAISEEKWLDVSDILFQITLDDIELDFQFFNEIAFKIWNRYSNGKIDDPMVLKGALHVLVLSPFSDPLITALTALHYCWHLDSLQSYQEAIEASESAINTIESYRDIFSTRRTDRIIAPTYRIPNSPHNADTIKYEKWIECLHTDLLTIWIKAKLNRGLQIDIELEKVRYAQEMEATMNECIRNKKLNGILSQRQQQEFDNLLNQPFKPPIHSEAAEQELMAFFKGNKAAKALLFTQMSFFRPQRASAFLEKARQLMHENEKIINSRKTNKSILYVNRYEIGLIFALKINGEKKVSVFGKEVVGATGLTTQNTALHGTGIRQEDVEPFIISKLKPNTEYSFGFGAYDSSNELIDTITTPFTVTTYHQLCDEMIWSYIASASFQLGDMPSFDVALSSLLGHFTEVSEIERDRQYFNNVNPFNRFRIKKESFEEPAPSLRAFASSLIMAGRLFAPTKPMHATAFQKVSLIIAVALKNSELALSVCNEIMSTIFPVLKNTFNTSWIVNPLLLVIDTLKNNKETSDSQLHQSLLSKSAFALDSIFVKLYQEKQIVEFIANSILEMPESKMKSEFTLFASKNLFLPHLKGKQPSSSEFQVENSTSQLFQSNQQKSFDELFNKYKTQPQFPAMAVFLVTAAHNTGMFELALKWCNTALEFIRSELAELVKKKEEPKEEPQSQSKAQAKKKPARSKKNEPPPPTEEELAQIKAATKIKEVWGVYKQRYDRNKKFFELNKWRAALNLLQGICMIETDPQMISISTLSSSFVKIQPPEKKNDDAEKKRSRPRPKVATFITDETCGVDFASQEENNNETDNPIIITLRRAVVLANRANDEIIIKSAVIYCQHYLSTVFGPLINTKSESRNDNEINFGSFLPLNSFVLIENCNLNEVCTQKLLREFLLLMLNGNQIDKIKLVLSSACQLSSNSGNLIWIIENLLQDTENNDEMASILNEVNFSIQKNRDSTENLFNSVNNVLKKLSRPKLFPNETAIFLNDQKNLIKKITDVSNSLQKKQRTSMSISLIQKLSFLLYKNGDNSIATTKLCEALECHFRMIKAHEKVDSILKDQTEESFYKTHSWSGCLSIFVISSLISLNIDKQQQKSLPRINHHLREVSMNLIRLSAFSLSSLFSNSSLNPKKQVDFAEFEPVEIVPGVDIFSELDPNNPLLEAPPADVVATSISHLISSMQSFELYFETFKPLSFARHFFRFIVRERRGLARFRLMAVMSCAKYGLLSSAFKVLNDVITSYGESKITRESSLFLDDSISKKVEFISSEPSGSPTNMAAARSLSSNELVDQISTQYGFPVSCLFAVAVSRVLQAMALSSDPSNALNNETFSSNGNGKRHKPKQTKRNDESASNSAASVSGEAFEVCIKAAESVVAYQSSKEFTAEQSSLRLELVLEKCYICQVLWKWEDSVSLACQVLNSSIFQQVETCPLYTIAPSLSPLGFVLEAKRIIAHSSYNMNDYQNTEKYASEVSPYLRSLVLIRKADMEGAAQILTQISLIKPITNFYKEYVFSVGQLLMLFIRDPKLIDKVKEKVNNNQRPLINPLEMVKKLNETVFSFFTDQLKLNEERSFFLLDTHLLVRLKHLEALVTVHFKGDQDPIEILAEAQTLLSTKCSYVNHGLSFLLNATVSRIQMQSFLRQSPSLIQLWNQDLDASIIEEKVPQEFVEKMSLLLQTIFAQNPDCVVHPMCQQCILDLVILSGVSTRSQSNLNDRSKRLELSLATLNIAYAVRTSRRFVQSLIATSPDAFPPTYSIPLLLFNDNKNCKLREIAASYYSCVCSLDLPLFDCGVNELRTLLFFKAFEEQLAPFRSLYGQNVADQSVLNFDAGQVVGQWYKVDANIFTQHLVDSISPPKTTTATGSSSARSSSSPRSIAQRKRASQNSSNNAASSSRSNFSAASSNAGAPLSARRKQGGMKSMMLKGTLLFFVGIVVEYEEKEKKKASSPKSPKNANNGSSNENDENSNHNNEPYKLTPLMIVAQQGDLKGCCADLAEIGVQIDEAARLESPEAAGDSPPNRNNEPGSARKKSKAKSRLTDVDPESQKYSAATLLKNQAAELVASASQKWGEALRQAETIFNKSNRIIAYLDEKRDKWPSEMKLNGIEMSNSTALSHFFNAQFGINEKVPQLAEWLAKSCSFSPNSNQVQKPQ